MRPALMILPFLALAACATPREQCIGQATRDLRVLNSLIAETQGNLARGYAIGEQQEVRTLRKTCRGENSDGTIFRYSCDETETFTAETQGNLARGYAIEEQQEVRTLRKTCRGENSDGTIFRYSCDETETFTTNRPVAIDLNVERAKLNSLVERRNQQQATSDQVVLQCIATHPE